MKRSTFLKSLLGVKIVSEFNQSLYAKNYSAQDQTDRRIIDELAGYKLKEIREQYHYDLFDDFLPFMERYVIDHEYGGFMCETDRDGNNISQNKNIWYEGRGIWVYSFLYNNFGNKAKYLDVTRKSVEFVMKHKPAGNHLWPKSLSREGKVIGRPAEDIYGDLFLANGFAEYSKAKYEDYYRDLAKNILLKCLTLYDDPEYTYDVYYGPPIKAEPGVRVLGHWMVILRLVTQMLENKPDTELEEISDRCVNAIMHHHLNPEFDLINEVLAHDMKRTDNAFAQFVYTGHALETLWMLLFEAIRRKNAELFIQASRYFKRHLEVAWDDVYNGVFRCLVHVDDNIWKLDKVLWLQEEVLIGLLCIIEHSATPWALTWFDKLYRYVKDKFPLKRYGFPLWILGADRKVTFERNSNRVGNFHHPRHLMLNLLAINRIIDRKGAVSELFNQDFKLRMDSL